MARTKEEEALIREELNKAHKAGIKGVQGSKMADAAGIKPKKPAAAPTEKPAAASTKPKPRLKKPVRISKGPKVKPRTGPIGFDKATSSVTGATTGPTPEPPPIPKGVRIKGKAMGAIEGVSKKIGGATQKIQGGKAKYSGFKKDVADVKKGIGGIKSEVKGLKEEIFGKPKPKTAPAAKAPKAPKTKAPATSSKLPLGQRLANKKAYRQSVKAAKGVGSKTPSRVARMGGRLGGLAKGLAEFELLKQAALGARGYRNEDTSLMERANRLRPFAPGLAGRIDKVRAGEEMAAPQSGDFLENLQMAMIGKGSQRGGIMGFGENFGRALTSAGQGVGMGVQGIADAVGYAATGDPRFINKTQAEEDQMSMGQKFMAGLRRPVDVFTDPENWKYTDEGQVADIRGFRESDAAQAEAQSMENYDAQLNEMVQSGVLDEVRSILQNPDQYDEVTVANAERAANNPMFREAFQRQAQLQGTEFLGFDTTGEAEGAALPPPPVSSQEGIIVGDPNLPRGETMTGTPGYESPAPMSGVERASRVAQAIGRLPAPQVEDPYSPEQAAYMPTPEGGRPPTRLESLILARAMNSRDTGLLAQAKEIRQRLSGGGPDARWQGIMKRREERAAKRHARDMERAGLESGTRMYEADAMAGRSDTVARDLTNQIRIRQSQLDKGVIEDEEAAQAELAELYAQLAAHYGAKRGVGRPR